MRSCPDHSSHGVRSSMFWIPLPTTNETGEPGYDYPGEDFNGWTKWARADSLGRGTHFACNFCTRKSQMLIGMTQCQSYAIVLIFYLRFQTFLRRVIAEADVAYNYPHQVTATGRCTMCFGTTQAHRKSVVPRPGSSHNHWNVEASALVSASTHKLDSSIVTLDELTVMLG